ncbi:MAG: hypothetical protein PGN07_07225 [Aeromicrobium erythreum]
MLRRSLLLVVSLVVGGGVLVGGPVQADDVEPPATAPVMMVIGDSNSSVTAGRYTLDGSTLPKVWWAFVAEKAGIPAKDVVVDAESGTGMRYGGNPKGKPTCPSKPFTSRLDEVRAARPTVLVVAGGRNDVARCSGRGIKTTASWHEMRTGVTTYLTQLAAVADEIGLPRSRVYVLNPWGSSRTTERAVIGPASERAARRLGLSYVVTPQIPDSRSSDTVHPNRDGVKWFADRIMGASTMVARLKEPDGTSAPAAGVVRARTSVDGGYARRRTTTVWGGPAKPGGTNYAAFRLTRALRAVYPTGATTAGSWGDAIMQHGGTVTRTPRAGDLAWWPEAPAGVGGTGHVALVTRAYETSAQVTEVVDGVTRSSTYKGVDLPRAYLRIATNDGSPTGLFQQVKAVSRSRVGITGYATDTDRYDSGARLLVRVEQGDRVLASTTLAATTFTFRREVGLKGARAGRAVVRVWALNASGSKGHAKVWIGSRNVTLP